MVILGILIALLTIFGIISSRLVTTFFHELGHATAALIFTQGPVVIYVGNYGDPKKCIKLKLGRLTMYLSYSIWHLNLGMCVHKAETSFIQALIIILSGPFMSLLIGSLLLVAISRTHFDDGEKFVIAVLIISAFWDFLVNIIPRETPAQLYDGSFVYNDGKQFQQLLRKTMLPDRYYEAQSLIREGKFDDAKAILKELILIEKGSRFYFESLLDIYFAEANYQEYLNTFENYMSSYDPSVRFVGKWAEAKIALHEYDEVIEKLTNIIYEGKGNYELHFRRGKALIELGEYKDALIDFHSLTLGQIEDPLALANRAYCQFRLDFIEEAKEDIEEAIQNSATPIGEIFYFAGIIFESSNGNLALEYFKKAQELKYNHHGLAFNISQLEKWKRSENE